MSRGDILNVWEGDQHVGIFARRWQKISFTYDPTYHGFPISLSMPVGGSWDKRIPGEFLANLVPDNLNQRNIMRQALSAKSIQPFDLLDRIDMAGGLVFSKMDNKPDKKSDMPLAPVSDSDLAELVRRARHTIGPVFNPANRYSLAGGQGKFTLRLQDGEWFETSATRPSTHIFKPENPDFPGSDLVENATMDLAALAGIPTPAHGIVHVNGTRSYVVERFDRCRIGGKIERIHCEDLYQAAGAFGDKYDVRAKQIMSCLQKADPTGKVPRQFIRQLVFNTLVGNADAHAKNYSIFIDNRTHRFAITPIYDAVSTTVWPQITPSQAMSINRKDYSWDIHQKDWRQFARLNKINEEWLVSTVRKEGAAILANVKKVAQQLPVPLDNRFVEVVSRDTKASLE